MSKQVLIATEKPFSPQALAAATGILEDAGCAVRLLEGYKEKNALLEAVAEANALIVRSDKITADVIAAATQLEIIVRAGAGYDNIDCPAAAERGIVVENTPGQNANAVAELAIGMMLMGARGKFSGKAGTELLGKTLGLQGFGNVARRLAKIAAGGFEMKVLAYDPYVPAERIREAGAEPVESLEDLYRRSDYLSLHVPSLPETRGSVNYALLSVMKSNATLVNTARADIVDDEDLIKIYREKPHFLYLADVPPSNKEQIVVCDETRCFFTPKKMGAQSAEANFNAATAAARQITAFFENGDTTFKVN